MDKHIWKSSFTQGCILVLLAYFALAGVFYYAAGEQLYERRSENEIACVPGGGTTPELAGECSIRQEFMCGMDIIDRFSVNIATFARENKGSIRMALRDVTQGRRLYSRSLRMEELEDGQVLECVLSEGAAGVRGHVLAVEILAEGAAAGNAAALWNAAAADAACLQLYVDQEAVDGAVCFSAGGRDSVWTGPHYWQLAAVCGGLLGAACLVLAYKKKKGKDSIVFRTAGMVKRYRFLVKQLVSRDFKIKYRRSALGALWSFVNPLMTMCVQYVVFSTLFKTDIANYPVYLLSGIVVFNFFTEATSVALHAISGNAGLITKVYVPKAIYPVSKVLSTGINLLVSLLPLLIMSFATGIRITKAWLLLPYDLACLVLFCIGIGMFLSAVMVFFRDMQFIWSVLCMVFTYVTPVFYPEAILSGPMRAALQWNPMHQYIVFFRTVILEGISPEPRLYVQCLLFSAASLLLGSAVFKKTQDKFIFYI